jgi:DnaJ-domain-containing protein 1
MFAERLFEEFFSRFYEFDSDEEYDSDDWDRRWDRANEEDRAAKNAEYAELLGVSEDAGPDIIKREYRRKALKYHPDKWSEDHEDGLSKEESEEHFKHIQNAYDHLMSNFDD